MGNILHSNNASSTLASGITAVATSITVGAGHGALFPAVGGGVYATLTIEDALGNIEIVHLTAKAGDVFTVVRAREGTAGFAFSSGARVENRVTAATLNEYLQKSGDTLLAAMAAGGFKITGLGLATARTDAASLANTQDQTGTYVATVGGTVNGITLTPSPAITAYAAGQRFNFIAAGDNTAAASVAVSGLSAQNLRKNGTAVLAAGDVRGGALVSIVYDGTNFQLLNAYSPAVIAPTTIELGHASDTTLARISAGEISIEGNKIHHAGNAPFGTWSPTGTAISNISSAVTVSGVAYSRVGNVVHCSFSLTCSCTTAGVGAAARFSLPVASALANVRQLSGAAAEEFGRFPVGIRANIANDEAEVNWTPDSTSSRTMTGSFSYEVI